MTPAGYIVHPHAVRLDRPVKAYDRWMNRIPSVYREAVLDESLAEKDAVRVGNDPHCLAMLKHHRSLMPLAQEARKPMFALTAADGALGAHAKAVRDCHRDFRALATSLAARCNLPLS